MRHRWLRLFLLLLVAVLVCPWPASAQKGTPSQAITMIRGQVRYASGPPAREGIMVVLEGELRGLISQTQTDSQGKFVFEQPGQGKFLIRVRQGGFQEVVYPVDLTMGPTAYVLVELKPLPGRQAETVSPEVTGPKVSVSALVIPEDAQKELEKGRKRLMDNRDPPGSLGYFRKAIQIYPNYAQAYALLGTAYMDMGNWKEAQPALEKAIELDDKLAAGHLALGSCHLQQGNFASAVKPLQRGLELLPDSVEGHYELGRSYWGLGLWQDAEPHARKAAELKSDFAPVHVLLGNIALRKRDAQAALHEFQEYLRLEPKGPMAGPAKEMVAKIQKALGSSQ